MRTVAKVVWDDKWILENIHKYSIITDLCNAYNESHGTTFSRSTINQHLSRKLNITSLATWTDEQRQWLKDNHDKFGSYQLAADMFNERFHTKRSHRSLHAELRRQGLLIDIEKVQSNWNYPRRVPIGTIVDDGDGYLKIKVGTEYNSSGWVRYHRYLYEQAHGRNSIPKGYKIMFLDGDKRNYDVNNMVAVPASYFALMNKLKLKSMYPEVTLAGIKWCDLYTLLKRDGWILKRGTFKNILD